MDDARLYLRVLDAGSLKAAAAQVGMDPSTVTRRMAALEDRLGVRLLHRSTRRTTPTDAGARYAEGLRRLLEQQDALEAELGGLATVPQGRLRITAPLDFGARFVVPVVAALQDQAPDLEVELELGHSFVSLTEQGIDVAIRVGRLADAALVARRLGAVPRVLVASPDYLARHGSPRRPEDLVDHRFVFYRRENQVARLELVGKDGPVSVPMSGRLYVNSVSAIVDLVAQGRGLHLGPRWAFYAALAAGAVVEVLPAYQTPAYPLHALYAPTPYVPAKIRLFLDAMAAAVRADPALSER